mmetsp:Transcript_29865/g.29025  ORF Transcript_29865/g.29025 Transcript_29865/m.29025 type:complete len:107 (-) Transcript_29865:461-781(-)|eukprot:CAMPEP_0170553852 /NCGR_PEP_ID=MMETSP0211-20121228/11675_1 /TAXON_ID=311385 /ORGANISM="Pseudokeronopsis sp., Strain OXSARD2" /LENGTH=106 /DNA_ID=CAMNT_0010862449 /DNA_START=53 /DNA_END=373 /DNA_ORIENTATION=-
MNDLLKKECSTELDYLEREVYQDSPRLTVKLKETPCVQDRQKNSLHNAIREKIKMENTRVQELIFLRRLEEDGKEGIVWEKDTLELLRFMEEEEKIKNNTNYKRAL